MDATAWLGDPMTGQDRLESLPGDLNVAFAPSIVHLPPRVRLAQLAREAATDSQSKLTHREFHHRSDGPHSSTELLAVLTFSYGTAMYTLERICRAIQEDVLFCSLMGPKIPHPDTIRAFRRQERTALRASLKRFFHLACALREEHVGSEAPSEGCTWLKAMGLRNPLPAGADHLEKPANERVNQATWIDRMMLDY